MNRGAIGSIRAASAVARAGRRAAVGLAVVAAALVFADPAAAQYATGEPTMSLAPAKNPSTLSPRDRRDPGPTFLCNRFKTEFAQALRSAPKVRNTYRARVLYTEAQILCRQGRPGEAQLKLEAAIRGIQGKTRPDTLITDAIAEREERRKQAEIYR